MTQAQGDESQVAHDQVLRSCCFSASIKRLTSSSVGAYPSKLVAEISHQVQIPSQREEVKAVDLVGPEDGVITLNIILKLNNQVLEVDRLLQSCNLIQEVLELVESKQNLSCIKKIGEPHAKDNGSTICGVKLWMKAVERNLENQLKVDGRPMARLKSINLDLDFKTKRVRYKEIDKRNNENSKKQKLDLRDDFVSLINTSALELPIKNLISSVINQFVHHYLFKRLPLIFNSEWNQTLCNSLPFQKSIAKSIYQLYINSQSAEIKCEIKKLTEGKKDKEFSRKVLDKNDKQKQKEEEEEVVRAIVTNLFGLQQSILLIPNTKVKGLRKSNTEDEDDLKEDIMSEDDHYGGRGDEDEDLNEDFDYDDNYEPEEVLELSQNLSEGKEDVEEIFDFHDNIFSY